MSLIESRPRAISEGPPWGLTAAYFRSLPLPRAAWAWEFLRRHPEYHADYARACAWSRPTEAPDAAAKWGLVLLENPEIHAREALVLWRADAQPGTLSARAHAASSARAIDLWTEPGRKAIAMTPAGAIVLLERDGDLYRLSFDGADALADKLVFEIRIGAPPEDSAELRTARAFLASFLAARAERHRLDPLAPKLARYLQSLDGHLAGASYAEIGRAIFPGDPLLRSPEGRALLKDRARHAVHRGLALMRGDYRSLLVPPRS
jgi:hypothetical protein